MDRIDSTDPLWLAVDPDARFRIDQPEMVWTGQPSGRPGNRDWDGSVSLPTANPVDHIFDGGLRVAVGASTLCLVPGLDVAVGRNSQTHLS